MHLLDVYDRFAWRWSLQSDKKPSREAYLKSTPYEWLSWYLDAAGNSRRRN